MNRQIIFMLLSTVFLGQETVFCMKRKLESCLNNTELCIDQNKKNKFEDDMDVDDQFDHVDLDAENKNCADFRAQKEEADKLNKFIYDGNLEETKKILSLNPDVINIKAGTYTETPLCRITAKSVTLLNMVDKEIFDYLLTFENVNIDAVDKQGYTALDYVITNIYFINDYTLSETNKLVLVYMFKSLSRKNAKTYIVDNHKIASAREYADQFTIEQLENNINELKYILC